VPAAAAVAAGAVVLPGSSATPRDYAAQAWNVLPPGQAGGVAFTRNSTDQTKLYDALTPMRDGVADADLGRFFKRATLGPGGERVVRTERPRAGLVIRRDRWGVPHVEGRTRADVTFGAGWVTAEDRQLIIELLRGPGRIAALDVPGIDAFALALSGRAFEPSPQAELALLQQYDLLGARGPEGRQAIKDIDSYIAGINAYYRRAGYPLKPWTRADVVAVAALVGAVFGAGGGDEVRRSQLLALLQGRLGGEEGRRVWEDLRQRDDPEARVSVEGRFRYGGRPADESGNVVVDPAGVRLRPTGKETTRLPMSNAIVLGSKRSRTGHPLLVAGPQVGHYYPGILMEVDLRGGGFDARGASFPGISFAVLLGRGIDYAWSATSAGSDLTDQYVETLCGDSDTTYLFQGRCREMATFDAGVLKGRPGEPDTRVMFHRTVHGPVSGYASVEGQRVAISSRRSTRGRELVSALFFLELSRNEISSARDFVAAASGMELTFNWLYADDRDIAQFTSGRLPLRPSSVDPGLPTKGSGGYEWQGYVAPSAHAQSINPRSGLILNWNNKPARGYAGADSEWTWGSVQRVDLLWDAVLRRQKHTLGSAVGAMNVAATQDLRSVRLVPLLAEAMRWTPAPTRRAETALALLEDWRRQGSSRLDVDLDGTIDHPGAAVLDAAWPRLADAVLSPVLGPLVDDLAAVVARDQPFNAGGSSFYEGWWSYVDKDLRALLGKSVRGAFMTRFCGGGDLAACSRSLWSALDRAAAELEAAKGADPRAWRASALPERIRFAPGILTQTMRGTNRPTFQQAISFDGHRPR
jgi:acyl-homoserine lactone acylase PvdQ